MSFSDTGNDLSDFINRKFLDQLLTVQGRLLALEFIYVFIIHLSVHICQRCAPAECIRLIEYSLFSPKKVTLSHTAGRRGFPPKCLWRQMWAAEIVSQSVRAQK
jgi:hypothetical protein